MDLGAFVFYVVAAVTVVAALGVVTTKNVVYSALLLILALMMTGLVYLMLLSDFLALVQILIYGGTVSVLLLFALMLTRPQERPIMNHRGWPVAAVGALVLLAVLVYQAVATPWRPASATASTAAAAATTAPVRVAPADLGMALFTTWSVPFEIASLVLLVALVGALLIARSSTEPDRDAVAAAARLHS
jgi:NADH-quinone oxidoreductase subunit J